MKKQAFYTWRFCCLSFAWSISKILNNITMSRSFPSKTFKIGTTKILKILVPYLPIIGFIHLNILRVLKIFFTFRATIPPEVHSNLDIFYDSSPKTSTYFRIHTKAPTKLNQKYSVHIDLLWLEQPVFWKLKLFLAFYFQMFHNIDKFQGLWYLTYLLKIWQLIELLGIFLFFKVHL